MYVIIGNVPRSHIVHMYVGYTLRVFSGKTLARIYTRTVELCHFIDNFPVHWSTIHVFFFGMSTFF